MNPRDIIPTITVVRGAWKTNDTKTFGLRLSINDGRKNIFLPDSEVERVATELVEHLDFLRKQNGRDNA
ncbi:hypothetical protein [Brachybacterium tyrofermentans]|uniref:hypothetical protein n=1 Tax=Brachybacterium tyrofermentans TaxID=47848 RepID=UPI003F8E027B